MSSDTSEKGFQDDIIAYLTGTGYVKRTTNDYDVNSCLDVDLVLKFIHATQPKAWKKFAKHNKSNAEARFIMSLVRQIKKKGTIAVLREGFRDIAKFDLFYPRPNNDLNPELKAKFNKNIFSVVDELEYQNKEKGNRLDLVIFINGIPISTIELKNTFTQSVDNAVNQYKFTRDPHEPLFKNCLVHFAMSNEEIKMTTKLDGAKTRFLPFNKGIENPEVKDNYNTSYLYTEILQKNQLSRLINNFIFEEDETVIFPRFHQLDCVNMLLEDPEPSHNYLIQHSAGSGKTKTIAWLAHGLKKFDENNKRIYDMVIVISDRKVIDAQLQDQVKAIERKQGVVEKIDKDSKQLAEAIKSGTNIVVTTLHKFSYILDKIEDVEDRNYAIIVDEAHSSQSGSHAKHLREGLTNAEADQDTLDEAEDEYDEALLDEMEKRRKTPNLSFFAFTATPKARTLEMFGKKDDDIGDYRPHHLYSMKQAIKEGFILDVLENYLTYPTYFKLVKTVEDDPEFDEDKAKRVLRRFVELHPHAIKEKTEIMLDHFMNSTIHKIQGKAKAMLVTGSRKEAVLYKLEFDRQIKARNLPIKTLAAFTGTIKQDTIEYTEANINDTKKSVKEAFKDDEYKILIVANKFQTGFDQPLLHTMYINKLLRGVAAVQTLSRANRIAPHKDDTLILDFVNDTDSIRESFEPYYGQTSLEKETDYHILYDLMEEIYKGMIFDEEEVEEFVKAYQKGVHQSKLHNLLEEPVKRFKRITDEKDKLLFKKLLRRYQSLYSFMAQLLPFSDLSLEKLYIYIKFLNRLLPGQVPDIIQGLLDDVDMDSYKIDTRDEGGPIILNDGEGELTGISGGIPSVFNDKEKTRLSQILEALNEAFATDFTDEDSLFVTQIANHIMSDEGFVNKVKSNPRENVAAIFGNIFEDELVTIYESNGTFYNKINNNPELKERLKNDLLDYVYEETGEQT